MLRTPAQPDPEVKPRGWDNPVYQCESCGVQKQSHLMIDVYIQVLSPYSVEPLTCIQHWACSTECWLKVMDACVHEHFLPRIQQLGG